MTAIIIVFALLVALVGFYVLMSQRIINFDETGLLVIFGEVKRELRSGRRFCPWLISKVLIYEKTPLIFEFLLPTAMTKNGIVAGYREDGGEIDRADISIRFTLTTFFDHNNLKETAANAPGNDASSIGPAIEPFVLGIMRSIASEVPWPLIDGERTKISKYALSKIIPNYEYYGIKHVPNTSKKTNIYSFDTNLETSDSADKMESYNPLVQFRLDLKKTTIEIQDVDFSDPKIREALNSVEVARLRCLSGLHDSELEAKKITDKRTAEAKMDERDGGVRAKNLKVEGVAKAEAREAMIKIIKDNPELEYLRALEEMAKGTSNTVLYEFPKAFSERISSVLGGSKLDDFSALIKDEKVMAFLKEAIKTATKK